MTGKKPAKGEVYLEYVIIGHMVKVSAVDALSGDEVSIAAPRDTPRSELDRIAIAKLRYVQNKSKSAR